MARELKFYRKKGCFFCKNNVEPSYKDVDALRRLTTERGKIISRTKTGTCASHQRKLAMAIKRARILALLPFVPKI
ncbi:MAG: 30S ribosomal protein S18 [bacterium]|nr:30S ribosomal protein S18 [bacterium]